jgi:hypothetical protein
VSGSYFYEKTGGTLSLSGSLSGAHLSLDEFADKTKTGGIEADLAEDGGLSGTWTDAAKSRTLKLHLAPIVAQASPASALVFNRTLHETRAVAGRKAKDQVCKTDLEYAEAFGLSPDAEAKVNARLAPSEDLLPPKTCDHAVETTARYSISHNADGILSVVVTGGVSDSQAAHPDVLDGVVTVWLATGADVKLFGDLLAPDAEPLVRRELAVAVDRLIREAGADADTRQLVLDSFGAAPTFAIEKAGIVLCASTPHFAAALGGCQYVVSLSKLPRSSIRVPTLVAK